MSKVLIITGDGGESYEALYVVHRFEEEGWEPVVAAPSRRRLNLVMHDFKPGRDTYIERHGYGMEAGVKFDDVRVDEYAAVLILGGRAPEYLRNNARVIEIVRGFDRQEKWIFAICQRGTEWAATGKVTQKVPADFPTVDNVSTRNEYDAPPGWVSPGGRPRARPQ